jgi:hypothetical protein
VVRLLFRRFLAWRPAIKSEILQFSSVHVIRH